MHIAAILDIVAAGRILLRQFADESRHHSMIGAHELILASAVVIAITAAELEARKGGRAIQFVYPAAALLFLLSTFPMLSESPLKDPASVAAYASVLVQVAGLFCSLAPRMMGARGIILGSAVLFVVLTVAGFIYTYGKNSRADQYDKFDAAVVLGASVWGRQTPSPVLKGRLDAAVRLFNLGRTNKIVVTGGTKRFGTVESAVEEAYLVDSGLPKGVVIAEESTLSTSDQARFIKNHLMDSMGMKKIAVVTDTWHLPRILLMCKWEDISVEGVPSSYKMMFLSEMYYRVRESVALQVYLLFGI